MCNIASMVSNEIPNQFHWHWTNLKLFWTNSVLGKHVETKGNCWNVQNIHTPAQIRLLKQWLWYTNIVSRYVVTPLDWKRGSRFTYQYAPCFQRRNWQPIVCTIGTTCVVGTIVPSTYLRNNWETTANACWHATGGTNGVTLLPRSIRIWDISCKKCRVGSCLYNRFRMRSRHPALGAKNK